MSIAHLLESFESFRNDDSPAIAISELSLEEAKLEAFERGYKAGWDDATQAQTEDRQRVTGDFANNLQELGFTYHEAYSHLTRALKPVLDQIVTSVLPDIARKSLGPRIVEQLAELAQAEGRQQVEIVVSPANADLMRTLLEKDTGFPVALIEEASLGEGQAFLRFGETERHIDHDEVLSGISEAVDAFFHELNQSMETEVDHAG